VAGVSLWLWFVLALLPAFAVPVAAAWRGGTAGRLVAVQLASVLASFLLIALTFALDEPALIDLALCLALLGVPGTLLMTVFLERWL
jgi:multicomponent Na+:H+ antiporter subunit F